MRQRRDWRELHLRGCSIPNRPMRHGIGVADLLLTHLPARIPKGSTGVTQSIRRSHVLLVRFMVCLGVASSLIAAQQELQSATVLLSHWELNEGSGTTITDSVDGGRGTLQNGAAWTAGRSGSAVSMDGVDDYIALPRQDTTGSAITLAAWLKTSSFPSGVNQRFIVKAVDDTEQRTYWVLGHANDGQNRLRFSLRAGGQTTTLTASTGTLPLNTWYHAAATYDGSWMRLYLNGTEVGSIAKSGSLTRGRNVAVNLGRSPNGTDYFHGVLDDVRIYSSTLTQAEIATLAGSGPAPPPSNQPPIVSLTAPESAAVFDAPATITLSATASDPDGSIAQVDFYHGQVLIGTDATSPYSVSWKDVGSGAYPLTAVARDNAGATTVSATRDITIRSLDLPDTAVFVPPSNHATAVDHYFLEIFPAGANPAVANAVASRNLGKPAIANGECRVDITATTSALAPGNYIATVTAVGSVGSARSAPSPPFTR